MGYDSRLISKKERKRRAKRLTHVKLFAAAPAKPGKVRVDNWIELADKSAIAHLKAILAAD